MNSVSVCCGPVAGHEMFIRYLGKDYMLIALLELKTQLGGAFKHMCAVRPHPMCWQGVVRLTVHENAHRGRVVDCIQWQKFEILKNEKGESLHGQDKR